MPPVSPSSWQITCALIDQTACALIDEKRVDKRSSQTVPQTPNRSTSSRPALPSPPTSRTAGEVADEVEGGFRVEAANDGEGCREGGAGQCGGGGVWAAGRVEPHQMVKPSTVTWPCNVRTRTGGATWGVWVWGGLQRAGKAAREVGKLGMNERAGHQGSRWRGRKN